jgi:hypothetical protein
MQITNMVGADQFERVMVETAVLRCEYIPALGGKLAQITDKRTGRDWLWRHPRLAYARVPATANYVAEADTGGWDECFPTVGACPYPDAPYADVILPDHGDLWCQVPETQVVQGADAVDIITRWQGLQLPYTFVRTMHIADDTVTVHYQVHNHGQAPLHWIWCAHPLIAIEPGMQLELPAGTTFWRMSEAGLCAEPATAIAVTPTQHWDMRQLPARDAGFSVKLYSAQLATGHVRLQATDGALLWSWQTTEIPQLAVFLNAGGWSNDDGPPHYNMGLEPAIGVYDALSDAYTHTQSYATLAPGQHRCWQLAVQLVADNPQ